MTTERLSLDERFQRAGLQPHQREAAGALVVLCELVDELVMATDRQNALLMRAAAESVGLNAGHNRDAGDDAGAAAPSGTAEGDDKEGGAQVQLREPGGIPPADPDAEPAGGTDRPVAEPSPAPSKARRQPAAKTAAAKKAAPAKTPTATREGRAQQ